MSGVDQHARTQELLSELYECLLSKGEANWTRGISAALGEMTPKSLDGFANAKSIYLTMVRGGSGFAEFAIWDECEDKQLLANKRIDAIRSELWNIFNMSHQI